MSNAVLQFMLHTLDDRLVAIADKARHRTTGEIVALKKLRMDRERDGRASTAAHCLHYGKADQFGGVKRHRHLSWLAGMPVTSVREVRVLQACRHTNLVQLMRVVCGAKLDR